MAATPPTTPPAMAPALDPLSDFGTGEGEGCWFEDSPGTAGDVVVEVLEEVADEEEVEEEEAEADESFRKFGFVSVTLPSTIHFPSPLSQQVELLAPQHQLSLGH